VNEEWKRLCGFDGKYFVSSLGRVKSKNNYKRKEDIYLKPCLSKGYFHIWLYEKGNGLIKRIHRLVCENFHKNPENKKQVNHINGIRTDNRAVNLEWSTSYENMRHAHKLGLVKCLRGERHQNSKLTQIEVLFAREFLNDGFFASYIGRGFKVSEGTIYDIHYNKTWKHLREEK